MELLQYLQDQAAEGARLDSQGEFTISASKALSKLAESQLSSPHLWVVKLVQFAVASGTDGIAFAYRKKLCEIVVKLNELPDLSEFYEALSRGKHCRDQALEHLVTALRAVGAQSGRKISLEFQEHDRIEGITWDGTVLKTWQQEGTKSEAQLLKIVATLSSPSAWGQLVDTSATKTRALEIKHLEEMAFTAPIPVIVDGREIQLHAFEKPDRFRKCVLSDFSEHPSGQQMPHRFLEFAKDSLRLIPDYEVKVSTFWHVHYNYILEHKSLHWNASPKPVPATSRLLWVKDGIVVKVAKIGNFEGLAVDLFLAADDCETDIGGLNLRHTESYEQLENLAIDQLLRIGGQVRKRLQETQRLPGKTNGGWAAFKISAAAFPLSKAVYSEPNSLACSLESTKAFQKQLLGSARKEAILFEENLNHDFLAKVKEL